MKVTIREINYKTIDLPEHVVESETVASYLENMIRNADVVIADTIEAEYQYREAVYDTWKDISV